MSGLAELGNLWHSIQTWLFPLLEDELGELDDRHREFIAVCETCQPPQAHDALPLDRQRLPSQGPSGAV